MADGGGGGRNVAELVRRTPDFALRSVLVGDPDLFSAIGAAASELTAYTRFSLTPAGAEREGPWVTAFEELGRAARARANARQRLLPRRRPALGPGDP